MALYHLHAKILSRSHGRNALASAAYRSASRLHDSLRTRQHDFTKKTGVIHSQILLPTGASEVFLDRGTLWNEVERVEKRKDAQLAREVEFALPCELKPVQAIGLARDFVRQQFVSRGMIADLNVHWDIARNGQKKPHAHVMLTMRHIDHTGFGQKNRAWNAKSLLLLWRKAWADLANERLATFGIDRRIDHRSYAAQGAPVPLRQADHLRHQGKALENLWPNARRTLDRAMGANPDLMDKMQQTQGTDRALILLRAIALQRQRDPFGVQQSLHPQHNHPEETDPDLPLPTPEGENSWRL